MFIIFCTLGGGTVLVMLSGIDTGSGMFSTLFSIWASISRAFRVRLPSFNVGTAEDSGCVKSVNVRSSLLEITLQFNFLKWD